MNLPPHLPARLYLLAFDPRGDRPRSRGHLGYLLRAAVLSDLQLGGHLTDDAGKARVQTSKAVCDPVLNGVLHEIADMAPRPWAHWIRRNRQATTRAVVSQLLDGGYLCRERYRLLGLIPMNKITMPDTRVRQQLIDTASAALSPTRPVTSVPPHDAALVALVAAGGLNTVLSRRQRREHKQRLMEFDKLAGPAPGALRKIRKQLQAAAAAAQPLPPS